MTITQVLDYTRKTLETIAVASVKAIKAHTYKVEVTNPDKSGERIVQGQRSVAAAIQRMQKDVVQAVEEVSDEIVELRKRETTKESDSSLKDVLGALQGLTEAVQKLPTEFPQMPEVRMPDVRIPESMTIDNLESLKGDDPKEYVPVRLTDGKKFYNAIAELVSSGGGRYAFKMENGTKAQATIDSQGRIVLSPLSMDPTAPYQIADEDTETTTKYYGFVNVDGGWYVLENDTTVGTYRYAKGNDDYPTAWTNRAAHTYEYFNEAFA